MSNGIGAVTTLGIASALVKIPFCVANIDNAYIVYLVFYVIVDKNQDIVEIKNKSINLRF